MLSPIAQIRSIFLELFSTLTFKLNSGWSLPRKIAFLRQNLKFCQDFLMNPYESVRDFYYILFSNFIIYHNVNNFYDKPWENLLYKIRSDYMTKPFCVVKTEPSDPGPQGGWFFLFRGMVSLTWTPWWAKYWCDTAWWWATFFDLWEKSKINAQSMQMDNVAFIRVGSLVTEHVSRTVNSQIAATTSWVDFI